MRSSWLFLTGLSSPDYDFIALLTWSLLFDDCRAVQSSLPSQHIHTAKTISTHSTLLLLHARAPLAKMYFHFRNLHELFALFKRLFCWKVFSGKETRSLKKKKPSFLQRKITSRFLSFKRIDAPCSLTNIHASVLWKFSSKKDKAGASSGMLIVFNSMPHSFAALSHEITSWTLEEKFHISTRPCIVLYITSSLCPENRWCNHVNLPYVWILARWFSGIYNFMRFRFSFTRFWWKPLTELRS